MPVYKYNVPGSPIQRRTAFTKPKIPTFKEEKLKKFGSSKEDKLKKRGSSSTLLSWSWDSENAEWHLIRESFDDPFGCSIDSFWREKQGARFGRKGDIPCASSGADQIRLSELHGPDLFAASVTKPICGSVSSIVMARQCFWKSS
ncbi:hypothetical protein H6P81_000620 [Aristolochia fimbriata]|uniref:Uncharacterized protein n=1 Tax=Aristolochia fimbriata TaxID=158543 RepID=A0AAV7F4T6_ARIFI|nr:hypothetical protein H6P81_000620 [Aristolochia fimbriata]